MRRGSIVRAAVCILAGGRGGRMGGNKCQKVLNGRRLIDRALEIALRVDEGESGLRVVVSSRMDEFDLGGIEVLRDLRGEGPIAGLFACLKAHGSTLIFPCDMPFLPPSLLRFLLAEGMQHEITVCRFGGLIQPQVGLYSERCLASLEEFLEEGNFSLFRFIRDGGMRVKLIEERHLGRFGDPGRMFFNINTPQDLARAGSEFDPPWSGQPDSGARESTDE